ncbi:hypothetical protein [Flavobacterium sp. RS13.1]|uniref:hypothetical protein n=1 Tax=Flavobacterium sp. RS13.1 TaxID=3400345 RepID=UPI003AADB5F8
MNNTLYAKIQEEFNHIADTFIEKEIDVLADENLITIRSKYNLYDIQPYFAELTNNVLAKDAKLTIESEEDFDPETDDLYEYKISFESRKTYLKREHYGGGVFYSTLYEYTEEYHKSFSVYQNKETVKAINLSYLYLKNGLPNQFIECTEYGISLKSYTCENGIIKNYKLEWPQHNHHCIGELIFDTKRNLEMITETASDGRVRILFDAKVSTKNIEEVLAQLETFLVENIADQILEKVKIEEPVYCILFEYTMQGPFPPTIAFGITSEVEGNFEDKELYELYYAPDMIYFSENEEPNLVDINFYPVNIQPFYLITTSYGENIPWQDEEACRIWEKQVFDTYLRVCKRLMHFDFSKSFTKTENFLVMARDFEQCNEDDFYQNMLLYRTKK